MTAPAAPATDPHAGGVPAYLPRAVFFGASSALGLITPQLRLDWEVVLIEARHDVFMLYLEGGGGYGLSLPKGFGNAGTDAMTFFYEHTLQVGFAYRAVYESGFAWGFHVGTGPVFYGARIQNQPTENIITGWVEGGAQIGIKAGPVVYGLALRYANLYDPPRHSLAGDFVGGFSLGVYAEWRP